VKAGKGLSLAFSEAGRESMSEAGPLAAKSGYQWRPGSRAPRASEGSGGWDLPVEGASDSWNVCGHDGRRGKRVWCSGAELGMPGEERGRDRSVCEPAYWAREGSTKPARSRARDTGQPREGQGVGSSWGRSVNCVTIQGRRCRQRLFGVAVDGGGWKLGRRSEGKLGTGRGGRKGESLKLGSGVFRRVLVTTSRLQRSGRSIFSWMNEGASAPEG
jgi:hypothetical protein